MADRTCSWCGRKMGPLQQGTHCCLECQRAPKTAHVPAVACAIFNYLQRCDAGVQDDAHKLEEQVEEEIGRDLTLEERSEIDKQINAISQEVAQRIRLHLPYVLHDKFWFGPNAPTFKE